MYYILDTLVKLVIETSQSSLSLFCTIRHIDLLEGVSINRLNLNSLTNKSAGACFRCLDAAASTGSRGRLKSCRSLGASLESFGRFTRCRKSFGTAGGLFGKPGCSSASSESLLRHKSFLRSTSCTKSTGLAEFKSFAQTKCLDGRRAF